MRYLRKTMKEMKQLAFNMLRGALVLSLCWFITPSFGQILDPVAWEFDLYETETEGELDLGDMGALIVPVIAVGLDAVIKWLKNNQKDEVEQCHMQLMRRALGSKRAYDSAV